MGRATAHESPNPLGMIHFAWTFLSVTDRAIAVRVNYTWRNYAMLRREAVVTPIESLRIPRPVLADADMPTSLAKEAATLHSVALLRFDFNLL